VVRLDEIATIGRDDALGLGQLVEARRHALGQPARVAEDDGGPVRHDQLEHTRVDTRPDALAHRAGERGVGRPAAQLGRLRDLTEIAHVLDRDDDVDRQRLTHTRIDDGDRARLVGRREPTEEPRHLFERALGGRQADALRRTGTQRVEPFERESEMGAALRGRQGVYLVDDHRFDPAKGVTRRRREHEVEALWRGDEQIGWTANEALAVTRRGVAGAQTDDGLGERHTQAFGRQTDPDQRRPQVLLDVEGEGSQG
jgi:hypothetical protein